MDPTTGVASHRASTGVPIPWRRLYRIAGVAAWAFVALQLAALVVDFVAPPPVHGGEETLQFIAEYKPIYIAEQLLWVLPNVLAVVVFVAFCVALWPVDRSLALVGTVVGAVGWAVFLAIPTTSRGSLILVYLSDRYSVVPADSRDVYAIAAEAVVAENNTPSVVGVLSCVGLLLISTVMLRGVFPRALGWLGIVTGAVGVAAETLRYAVEPAYLAYGVLLWAWCVFSGAALLRLARGVSARPPRSGSR